MVYVDSAPGIGASAPDFDGVEKPLPAREELAKEENLHGLSEEQLETFRRRAVPQPGGVLREAAMLTNDARGDIPTTVVCTGFTSAQVRAAVKEGHAWLRGLAELRDVTWVNLPTSPLADVVASPRARRDHRGRREDARQSRVAPPVWSACASPACVGGVPWACHVMSV